jgi:metal-sulfur cluster biosynthetic enzyme
MVPDDLHASIERALRTVDDPELGVDVVALGLVRAIHVGEGGLVSVDLTMTTAACPLGDLIVEQARQAVAAVPGVSSVGVRLVWEPPWKPADMRPEARAALGWGAEDEPPGDLAGEP